MIDILRALFGPAQRFFLPGTILLLVVFCYLVVVKKDKAAGLVLVLGLIIISDSWMATGIFLPFFESGSIRYSEIVLLILFYRHVRETREENALRSRMIRFFAVYLLFFLISVLRSDAITHNLFRNFRDLGFVPFLIFIVASSGFKELKDYRKFFIYLIILGLLITFGSFQEFMFDRIFIKGSSVYEKTYHSQRAGRFGSFFGNPNMLAGFYLLILPLFLLLIVEARTKLMKCMHLSAWLFLAFGLFKTFTRAAFLSLPLSIFPILIFRIRGVSFLKKILGVFFIIAILAVLSPRIFTGVSGRLSTIEDKNEVESSRFMIWKGTITVMLKNSQLLGAGFGEDSFIRAASDALNKGRLNEDMANAMITAQMPHNSYLYILFFLGVFPLIIFIIMLTSFFRNVYREILTKADSDFYLPCLGITCGIIGFCLAAFFDFQLFVKSTAATFWCLLAIATSMVKFYVPAGEPEADLRQNDR